MAHLVGNGAGPPMGRPETEVGAASIAINQQFCFNIGFAALFGD